MVNEGRGGGREEEIKVMVSEESIAYLLCIFVSLCFAGFNIVSKVALDGGMSCYVLVVYGNAIGTLTTALLALIFERNNKHKITFPILRDIFFLGLLGCLLGRTLFYKGLQHTSSAFASALSNLIPSITFILAVICRMEKISIIMHSTQAKIGGTIAAFAGATLMILYKGLVVIPTLTRHKHKTGSPKILQDGHWIQGSLMLLISFLSLAAYYVLQSSTIKKYSSPMALTSLTCLVGTILSTIMTAILDHKASSWRLSWNITLLGPLYSGIMIFGISSYVQTVAIKIKGPVFVSAFRPLSTIIVTILGLLILGDALHLGAMVGAILIILGLYATLWGKENEKQQQKLLEQTKEEDVESKLDKEYNLK